MTVQIFSKFLAGIFFTCCFSWSFVWPSIWPSGWQKGPQIGGKGFNQLHALSPLPEGGFLAAGAFSDTVSFDYLKIGATDGGIDLFLLRMDGTGSPLWVKRGGGPGYDAALSVTADPFQNIFLGGMVMPLSVEYLNRSNQYPDDIPPDGFVSAYDSHGEIQWMRRLGGAGEDAVLDVIADSTGVYVTGYFSQTAQFPANEELRIKSRGGRDGFIAKFSVSGKLLRTRHVSSLENLKCVALAGYTGGVFLTGEFEKTMRVENGNGDWHRLKSSGGTDLFLLRWSEKGELLDPVSFGGDADESVCCIQTSANGSLILAGAFQSTLQLDSTQLKSKGDFDGFVVSFPGPSPDWVVQFGGYAKDEIAGMGIHDSGMVILSGNFSGKVVMGNEILDEDHFGYFLARIDSAGTVVNAYGVGAPGMKAGPVVRTSEGFWHAGNLFLEPIDPTITERPEKTQIKSE